MKIEIDIRDKYDLIEHMVLIEENSRRKAIWKAIKLFIIIYFKPIKL